MSIVQNVMKNYYRSKSNHKDTYVTKMIVPIIYNATKEEIDTVLINTHKCVEEFLKEI